MADSATRRALAQGAYYASQGRAVEHAARRQQRAARARTSPGGDVQSGGPRQLERAQAYRTSRPYYRTYRQVWAGTPKVKGTEAALQRAGPPARKGDKRAQADYQHHLRLYNRELRHGPDILSSEAYGKYAKGLWGRAGKFYPHPQDMPKTVVDYDPAQRKRALAWVMHDQPNVVHVSPETTRMFMGSKGLRGPSETVPLHEWAHTRQPLNERSMATLEGGAEAVDRLIARRLKLPYIKSPDPNYRRWAGKARRRGKGYLLKGQYRG